MILGLDQVVYHQPEEEEESKEMCPDVDSLIVEPEYAPDTALVVQGLPVPCCDVFLLRIVRNILDIQQLKVIGIFFLNVFFSVNVSVVMTISNILISIHSIIHIIITVHSISLVTLSHHCSITDSLSQLAELHHHTALG